MADIYQPETTDFTTAVDYKYVFKNAFNEGVNLPKIINDLVGYGSYAPMNQLRDLSQPLFPRTL